MIRADATNLLKAEKYLRFHDLQAGPAYDAMTLWVDGAEISDEEQDAGTGNPRIDKILGPVHAIESGPGCLRYKVVFDHCVAYAWRDESYVIPETDEDFSSMLRRYENSAYLDYIAASTFAADATGFPLQHVAIVTLDAVVDVVCADEPEITAHMLGPDDPGPKPGRPAEFG